MVFGNLLVAGSIALLAFAILLTNQNNQLKEFKIPPPPQLTGALSKKVIKGEKLLEGRVRGPESIVYENGVLYTCLIEGDCVKIVDGKIRKSVRLTKHKKCDGTLHSFTYCGRPLGIRRFNDKTFIVVDPLLGVYAIDFEKENSELLFSTRNRVGGLVQKFPDDFDFISNDTIVYSDASTKYSMDQFMAPFLEACEDGRVIKLQLSTGRAEVLVDGLNFPNGIQTHPDKQSVLISESSTAKIHRVYFAGPKKGQHDIFNDNLPGFPDNIRISADKKSFYVALFALRFENNLSLFDHLASKPLLRYFLSKIVNLLPEPLVMRLLNFSSSEYGIFVQLDLDGNIIDSYHDPDGKIIQSISQVTDDGGKYLYLGSFSNAYIGRVLKH